MLVQAAIRAGLGKYRKHSQYERTATEAFLRSIQPGDVVADCGVCYGYYTALALRAGASTVWAFEPDPEHIESLQHEFRKREQVRFVTKAVSDHSGSVQLFKVRKAGGRGISATKELALLGRSKNVEAKVVTIHCVSLDDALVDGVNVIKIDTEGSEVAIMRGAKKVLAKYSPVLFMSIHSIAPAAVEELRGLIAEAGYVFRDLVTDEIFEPDPMRGSFKLTKG